jgi:hypothetical protein
MLQTLEPWGNHRNQDWQPVLLVIHRNQLPELLERWPELGQSMILSLLVRVQSKIQMLEH